MTSRLDHVEALPDQGATKIHSPEKQDIAEECEAMKAGSIVGLQNEATHRGFKPRHAQMIALGGAIGTSLFLGSAQALFVGGPCFLLVAYCIMSAVVYGVVTAIAEVASYLPVPGGTMSYYGDKYVSKSMGFAMGYLYWYSLGVLIPYELVASNLLIEYWNPPVSSAVWISIILVVIVVCNFLPVHMYGEAEFWSAGMKILLIVGLIFLSIVLFFGGGPDKDFLGFRYWGKPGPTKIFIVNGSAGRFVAFLRTLVLASFAFILAPEQLIVTAGEMQSPRSNLPKAARRYFWRLIILFIPSIIGISVICPSDSPKLQSEGSSSSPFVIAIHTAGIPVLDSIVNALILLSACTAGNAFLYSASRNLYSLAVAGNAPRIFKRCNRWGLPYVSVAVTASMGLLAYLSLSSTSLSVFNWLINITNCSGYISWLCCTVIYTRFKKAVALHGCELPYKPRVQPWGLYFGAFVSAALLLLNGFTVFFPGKWSVADFLAAYIGIPIFLAIYLGHRFYHRGDTWARDVRDIDMFQGMAEVLAAERPPPQRGWWARKLFVLIE